MRKRERRFFADSRKIKGIWTFGDSFQSPKALARLAKEEEIMDLSSRDWRMLIDGEMFAGAKRRDVVSPTTGRVIASVPEADVADAERALAAARRAQRGWGGMAPLERAQVMKRVSALLRRDADALARSKASRSPRRAAKLAAPPSSSTISPNSRAASK